MKNTIVATDADRHAAAEWARFLEDINTARGQLGCGKGSRHEAWFRGHINSNYSLLPSLFRHFPDPNTKNIWDDIWQKESDLYWEFSARARELHGVIESDWDILFAMQHHGTPTRLLDWTEVLGVAIYFAILNVDATEQAGKQSPQPCVWVLNPYQLNECSDWDADLISPSILGWDEKSETYYSYSELLLEDGIGWDWPVAIYPRQRTSRIHAQRGKFTIHGNEFSPIDQFKDHPKYLRKVELPWAALPKAREFLELAGINHYSLFPDLQNLSLHLREKYALVPTAKAPNPKPKSKPRRKQ